MKTDITKEQRERIENRVRNARHMSKPEAKNTIVVRDANGRWLFEMYPGIPPAARR